MSKLRYTLRELRARIDKTQAQVAADLGVSTTTYHGWEQDLSNVGISKVYALANYFGVTIDDIKWRRG